MKPKVTVVMPVYKAEKFLRIGLDCLTNQTLKEIAVICVNDASPDNSKDILEEYAKKDDRIVIINHDTNQGASKSRNDGLDYIFENIPDTEFIAFFDADDKIELNAYEKCYKEAIEHNADILNFNFLPSTYWEYKTEPTGDAIEYVNNCIETLFDFNEFYTFIVCWSKIYKKELLKDIRFPEQKFFEDGAFAYKVLPKAKKLRLIPDTLYEYNIENPNSTCCDMDEIKRLKDIFKTMKDTLNEWKKIGISEEYKYKFIKHILLYTSLVCPNILNGDYRKQLNENLEINVNDELENDNIPKETKDIIKRMIKE